MKKFSIYSFLVASVLFTTGCSEKNVEMNVDSAPVAQTSEAALNTIPATTIDDGSFSMEERTGDGVYYTINGKRVLIENIYFAFDKYNLSDTEKSKAVSNASKLSPLNSATTVKVSGNTDEWGTDEYNYALGLKRAKAVKDVLVTNGVSANVSLVSLGESSPVCTEKNAACWQKNRRAEHSLTK